MIPYNVATFRSCHSSLSTNSYEIPKISPLPPNLCAILACSLGKRYLSTSNPIPFTISSFFALSPPLPCHLDGKIIEFRCFMHTLMPVEPFKSLSVCRTLSMTCPGSLALRDIRLCLDKCIQVLSAPNASLCLRHTQSHSLMLK